MNKPVYKSADGRRIVEAAYRAYLDSELAAGLTQRRIDTVEGSTFVLEKAAPGKPPLVLLHGSVSNSASWLGVIPIFACDFSVYCVDIPGEPGLSEPSRFPLASSSPEAWLKETLDALGLHRVAFLGMSLGGWYALNFAVKNPERVSALSLVSVGGIGAQRIGFLFKALFFLLLGKRGQALLNRAIYLKAEVPAEILEYQALVSKHFIPLSESLPIFTDAELARLDMPVQYFAGDRDALLDAEGAVERFRRILPDAQAVLLEDTGHVIVDRFEVARDFLAASSKK